MKFDSKNDRKNLFFDIMNRERSNLNEFKYNVKYKLSNKFLTNNNKNIKSYKNITNTNLNYYPNIKTKYDIKYNENKTNRQIMFNKNKDISNKVVFPYLFNINNHKAIEDSAKQNNEIEINMSNNNDFIIDINEENNKKFENDLKITKNLSYKNLNNKKSNNIKILKNKKNKKNKINLDEIRNIDNKNKIINNDGMEKIINIRMKANKSKRGNNTMVYYNSNNNIFKNKKEGFNFGLANFSYYQNDFLSLKNLINRYEKKESNNKNKTIFGKEGNLAFNQSNDKKNEDIFYKSKYFLPSNGYGLLKKKI